MRNRVERLRVWLLASAGFLLLVIGSFLWGAHYLRRHRVELPKRLGINIVQETDGFTYSQALQGHTVFTIHASKAITHADNKVTLRDVSITMYGAKQDRNDRIYGDEFEYDKAAQELRATGLVHIDLQAAQPSGGKAPADAAHVLHVTTRGLVYLQALGVAATSEQLVFESGAIKGQATGADYSRDTGLLMLHSAVTMSGMAGTRPVTLTAATADLDNRNRQMFLTYAHCSSGGEAVAADRATLHSRADGTLERVEAEGNVTTEANGSRIVSQRADVALNASSQMQRALLTGGVQYGLEQPLRQMHGQAGQATIDFDGEGEARHAEFVGSVHVVERMRATGDTREPWSTRDLTATKVETVLGPVRAGEGNRVQSAGSQSVGSKSAGAAQLRDAEAIGSARLSVVDNGSLAHAHGRATTELSGDDLKAHLIAARDAKLSPQLDTVAGRGNTMLHQASSDGVDQTCSGESLDAKFRAGGWVRAGSANAKSSAGSKFGEGVDDLLSAVQQGHVTLTRRAPAKAGGKLGGATGGSALGQQEVEQATAQKATYDGELDQVVLSGGAQVSDRTSVLWADQVVIHRSSGDAQAAGSVKVSYLQAQQGGRLGSEPSGLHGTAPGATAPGSTLQPAAPVEPTHVVAERGELVHATGVATFYGKPARLWQAGSQVQAAVIQLQRVEQRMIAHGDATSAARGQQVRTILASAGSALAGQDQAGTAKTGTAKAGKAAAVSGQPKPRLVRVTSGGLVYSGELRQAEFTGSVRAETVDGTIRANQATIYLQDEAKGRTGSGSGATSALATPALAGQVERMVANGQIEIEQTGRRATGGHLVYTANDEADSGTANGGISSGGLFVLTGDGKVQPRMVDAVRGTITGAALQFHSGDDRVVVTNVEPEAATGAGAAQRVHSETRVGKDLSKDAGKGKGK